MFVLFICSAVLEKNLRQLMECVDDVAMDTNKYLNFQRQNFRQQQAKQQHLLKRVWRKLCFYYLRKTEIYQACFFFTGPLILLIAIQTKMTIGVESNLVLNLPNPALLSSLFFTTLVTCQILMFLDTKMITRLKAFSV